MVSDEEEEIFCKAKDIVYRLLNNRLRSEQEIRLALMSKNFSPPIIERVLQYFQELDLINDVKFAQQWFSSRLQKPFGLNRICLELKQKGVDAAVIEQTLNDLRQAYDELQIVTMLAHRRKSRYKDATAQQMKRRVYGYLKRRGFTAAVILKAVQTL